MLVEPANDALGRLALEVLEAAYRRIGDTLSAYSANRVTIILYTRENFRDATGAREWSAGIYDGRIKVRMRSDLTISELERVLVHEFVAVIDSVAGEDVPVWINEGLATALEPGRRGAAHSRS